MAKATKEVSDGFSGLLTKVGPLALALLAGQKAMQIWEAGLRSADLKDQAEQIGLTTDQLQAYRFVALQAGVTNEQLDQSMTRLTASMGAAAKGGEDQIKIFGQLGVKILDSKGQLRSAADVMPEVARGLLGLGNETQRNALLMELFGKSGTTDHSKTASLIVGTTSIVVAGYMVNPDYADHSDEMSHDIVNFLAWAAEPNLEARHRMGFKVILFLVIATGIFYAAKRKIWARVH